jgi:hypothetical protein
LSAAQGGSTPQEHLCPIADLGQIGDLQAAMLVTTDETIGWYGTPL